MDIFRRFCYSLRYLRNPPWDNNVVPPEVEEFIANHPPACALDLGCGSGTSSIELARDHWQVTGVDFVSSAIRRARRNAAAASLEVDFIIADVTRLPASILASRFSLVLDIGCFHGLSPSGKGSYLEQLRTLLSPGATWLLYGFISDRHGKEHTPPPAILPDDLDRAGEFMSLTRKREGYDHDRHPSAWFWFERIS